MLRVAMRAGITQLARIRGQPVRRSFRFMLKVGLASEARSTAATSAKAEGRRRQPARRSLGFVGFKFRWLAKSGERSASQEGL